jgi:molecular chaperone Hsp33
MKDILYKGHFKNIDIAFTYAVTTETVNTGVVTHNCDPISAHILSRALTSGLLSAVLLPEKQRLNACWKYNGTLRTIVIDAGADGTVRGFLSPTQLSGTSQNLDELYGEKGSIQVVTSENDKILNSGTSEIALHDVVNDLAFYYCVSHQIETEMMVMVGFDNNPAHPVKLCRGWMLQALPGADLELFAKIRNRMNSEEFRTLMINENNTDGYFEELSNNLLKDIDIKPEIEMDWGPTPAFKCTCTHEKISTVLKTIPIPERMEIVKERKDLTIKCQFCNKPYKLTIAECSKIWNENIKKPNTL